MIRTMRILAVWLTATLMASAVMAAAEMKQIPVVRLQATADVAALPAAVWAQLTQGKNLVTWCPVWKNAANSKVAVTRVGDVIQYMDEWNHGGRSVVTFLAKNKELRVVHEPTDGSYICQAKMILAPTASGTALHYTEQYTDESKPADLQATAQKMESEMQQSLAAIKKAAEKK